MNADALKAWRAAMGWKKQEEAADRLGMSLSAYQSAETGRRPVSRTVELACRWLEHEAGLGAPRTSCDEPVADASLEARLNAIEQRLLPDADRAFVLRWHAAWLARQPLPAATLSKAVKGWQSDDDMSEEEHEAAKDRVRASLPPEDEIQRQIRQGMLDQREREKLERAKKQQAEEMATIARRAARSVLPD